MNKHIYHELDYTIMKEINTLENILSGMYKSGKFGKIIKQKNIKKNNS